MEESERSNAVACARWRVCCMRFGIARRRDTAARCWWRYEPRSAGRTSYAARRRDAFVPPTGVRRHGGSDAAIHIRTVLNVIVVTPPAADVCRMAPVKRIRREGCWHVTSRHASAALDNAEPQC